jgi:hypothetical protein
MLAGKHEVDFNAKKLSSGEYYYSLESGATRLFQKMMITK